MPAVSKAQQRFMGMVHATQKGDMEAPSKEVEKVADTMKKVDAKDFASTKHKGLPTHVKEKIKEIIRGVMKAEGAFGSVIGGPEDARNLTEMSPNDTHFKGIMAMYDKGGSFAKKKVGAAVSKNPNASRNQIVDDLKDLDYQEILDTEAQLGLDETIIEEFKHLISVETPTQVVSKPIAAQILALAKKGVRSSEIGLKMGFVGNQKAATDAFQKVKNKIYFSLDKRNESINEIEYKDAVEKFNADLMKNSQVERIAKFHKRSIKDVVKALQPYLKVLRYSDKSIKVISIDFRDTNSDVKVHVSQTYKQNESVNEAKTYSNKFAAWFTGTVLNNVKHPTYGKHQLTADQIEKAPGDYKDKLFKAIEMAVKNGDITPDIIKKNESVNEDSHDCGCNENHDCGCGGLHTH
ncbi:DUF3008 family protein [archaeon]|nr:DUF3008 family protein [archaeon]NDB55052.1 DUF3008 family protein [archaeon]